MKADGNMTEEMIIPDEQLGIIVTERTPVECLDIPVRAMHVLKQNGFQTVSDVIGRTSSDLYMLDFFGWRSFEKLVEELDGNGFDLMDCNKELYPTINDYLTECRNNYVQYFYVESEMS
jgi:DNA-directed RNA polymerase alpha subunit